MTLEARGALRAEGAPDVPEDGFLSTVYPLLPAMWLPVCLVAFCAYLYAIFGRKL